MTFHRQCLCLVLAGLLVATRTWSQETTESGSAGTSSGSSSGKASSSSSAPASTSSRRAPGTSPGAGSSSSFGSAPATGTTAPGTGANTPFSSPAATGGDAGPGRNSGTAPSFRTAPNASQPGGATPSTFTTGGQPATGATGTGAASSFGGEGQPGAGATKPAAETYVVPGAYGRAPLQFTAGEGVLARPRFRYTSSASIGYDDNTLQTPTNGVDIPERTVQQLVAPGSPAGPQQVAVPGKEPMTVNVPATAPRSRNVTIPGVSAPKRQGSFIGQANVGLDVQFISRRTLFTFDITGGGSYYFNRPGRSTEFEGALSLIYLRRITNRLQFSANVSAAYSSQPDLSQVNTPTRTGSGSYLTVNAKADVSYRLTPRFSTVTSVSYSALRYQERVQQPGDYNSITLGTGLRYLFSPRLTLVGEFRYSQVFYSAVTGQDSHTYFLLTGGDLRLSKRFSSTLRVGAALRTQEETGDTSTSPFLENTLSYQLARGTSVSLNNRYGFEETSTANSRVLTLRSGVSVSHIFTPRLRGSISLFFVNSRTDSGTTSSSDDSFQASLGLDYTLNRHWSFNLNYQYTTLFSEAKTNNYYRNRIFLGASYQF